MIDMEECLFTGALPSQYHVFRDYAEKCADLSAAVAEVKQGVTTLFSSLHAHPAVTAHLLKHATFRTDAPFTNMYPDPDTLFGIWSTFYGL